MTQGLDQKNESLQKAHVKIRVFATFSVMLYMFPGNSPNL